MRAYAIDEFGRPGSVRDLPTPEPTEGEVLLRVRAAGVNAIDATDPREEEDVVVLGATGGVGSYVTQLAGNRGARVAAVTRGENAEYARGLGASTVIDYTAGDLADLVQATFPDGIDILIDLIGDGTLV